MESEKAEARKLEVVLRILESTSSNKTRAKAHEYIARRIKTAEGEGKAGGRGSLGGSVGKGVGIGIIVTAALAFYAENQKAIAGEPEWEERATLGSK